MATILDHRNEILQALTLALDACIKQESVHLDGYDVKELDAYITFRFNGTDSRIQSNPCLDFREPLEPQLRAAKGVELHLQVDPTE